MRTLAMSRGHRAAPLGSTLFRTGAIPIEFSMHGYVAENWWMAFIRNWALVLAVAVVIAVFVDENA